MVIDLVKTQNVKNNKKIPIVFDIVNAVTMCYGCPVKDLNPSQDSRKIWKPNNFHRKLFGNQNKVGDIVGSIVLYKRHCHFTTINFANVLMHLTLI